MKRIYLLLIAAVALINTASGQVDLKSTLIKPAQGSTITMAPFDLECVVTVMSGNIMAGDSVLVFWSGSGGTALFRKGLMKSTGDTIHFKTSLQLNSSVQSQNNVRFCVLPQIRNNGIKTDPSHGNDTGCNNININNPTGIENVLNFSKADVDHAKLNIVPNPATNEIGFDFSTQTSTPVSARVIDITGREVLATNLGSGYIGTKNYKLNVSDLVSGIYFVQIRQGDNKAVGKLIKQ